MTARCSKSHSNCCASKAQALKTRKYGANVPPPVTGKANVNVVRADAVGRYAVRISFDDGHDTGLYSWDLLYDLGRDKDEKPASIATRCAGAA